MSTTKASSSVFESLELAQGEEDTDGIPIAWWSLCFGAFSLLSDSTRMASFKVLA